jgi:hypothetical protein
MIAWKDANRVVYLDMLLIHGIQETNEDIKFEPKMQCHSRLSVVEKGEVNGQRKGR